MKKYLLPLSIFVFVLSFFIFNTKSVNALVPGCNSTSGFSSVNGEPCAPTPAPTPSCTNGFNPSTGFICGCTSTTGFSSVNGLSCDPNPIPEPTPVPTPVCTTSGYNPATGFKCGCSSTFGFSSINGLSCAPTPEPTPVPASTCTSMGVDSVSGFVCGCSSRSGWSSTSGRSCTGCDSESGYNLLTGLSCAPVPAPAPSCTNGYNSSDGFRCGCSSTVGYSSIDGRPCSVETFPSGCSSHLGFSTTTGQSCNGSTNPPSTSPANPPSIPPIISNPSSSCTITSILRIGSTGDEVSCLQSLIGLVVDGRFGLRTQIAVKAFQANAGLRADGIVGPKSVAALEVDN